MLPSPQNEAVLKNISCYNHSYNGYYVNITSVQSQHNVRSIVVGWSGVLQRGLLLGLELRFL